MVVTVRIDGVRAVLRALRDVPPDANNALKDRTATLTNVLASKIRWAARAEGSQAAAIANTVKPRRDRVPSVQAGGSRRFGRHRSAAWEVLAGSEFGMNRRSGWYGAARYAGSTGRQFKPHLGRGSYWFFKTVEDNERQIGATWLAVADDVVREFGKGA